MPGSATGSRALTARVPEVLANGEIVGKTTSAAFGYRVGKPLAIAQVDCAAVQPVEGVEVGVDIAGAVFGGRLPLPAAYDPDGKAMRPGA